jgi:hypothetical protein
VNQIVGKKENGSQFVALVLEPGNLHLLQQKRPIKLRIEDMFPDGIPKRLELAIYYSETPIADAREFASMAEVALDERSSRQAEKRPHCPECRSTIEQLGMMKYEAGPVDLMFCPTCGCVLSLIPKVRMEPKP